MTSRRRSVVLLSSSDPRNIPVRFSVPEEEDDGGGGAGVDLGAVGRALGLDPASVRLNGHYLSRGPDHVSTVTWASLLSFFSSRGFPAGDSDRRPVLVQGRPGPTADPRGFHTPSDLEDEDYLSFKRKINLEDESPSKKNRTFAPNKSGYAEERLRKDGSMYIGRMELDDNQPYKKAKINHCSLAPGLANEPSKLPPTIPRTGITYNCINGMRKRLREDETAMSISCKRIK
ncbi:Uncharacterized protein M6B38_240405 [Iris pallida]|uniref:Uncharacterized protein n=1 Tax=Iris pallida TaxID=29817 RepID=A0AAX6DKA6_IRIPA|nr:Uncharacterized protein M6B38_240405 [Iris pallida]